MTEEYRINKHPAVVAAMELKPESRYIIIVDESKSTTTGVNMLKAELERKGFNTVVVAADPAAIQVYEVE